MAGFVARNKVEGKKRGGDGRSFYNCPSTILSHLLSFIVVTKVRTKEGMDGIGQAHV